MGPVLVDAELPQTAHSSASSLPLYAVSSCLCFAYIEQRLLNPAQDRRMIGPQSHGMNEHEGQTVGDLATRKAHDIELTA